MTKETKTHKKRFLDSWTFLIIFCILLPLSFRSLAYEPFHIPSGSMKPTLLEGDFIFVSKFAYGWSRYSFPFGLPFFKGRIGFEMPERGDIAVFRPATMPGTDYIKRVIGLPGDHVQVKESQLYLNGQPVKRVEDGYFLELNGNVTKEIRQYKQRLNAETEFNILDETPRGLLDNTPEFIVPDGHFFLMGDNRDNSADSRTAPVGFIPVEHLIGRAEIIFVSTKSSLWKVWRWFSDFRGGRFLKSLNAHETKI